MRGLNDIMLQNIKADDFSVTFLTNPHMLEACQFVQMLILWLDIPCETKITAFYKPKVLKKKKKNAVLRPFWPCGQTYIWGWTISRVSYYIFKKPPGQKLI